ncbi:hypothetical protein BDQ17DRAFT_1426390 [Cyathus striatus]|nr:hypothetical protein BDQ17DRAFT_1426390 [Cyathus striatus]
MPNPPPYNYKFTSHTMLATVQSNRNPTRASGAPNALAAALSPNSNSYILTAKPAPRTNTKGSFKVLPLSKKNTGASATTPGQQSVSTMGAKRKSSELGPTSPRHLQLNENQMDVDRPLEGGQNTSAQQPPVSSPPSQSSPTDGMDTEAHGEQQENVPGAPPSNANPTVPVKATTTADNAPTNALSQTTASNTSSPMAAGESSPE